MSGNQNPMMILASKLMQSLSDLTKTSDTIPSKRIDEHLQTMESILAQNLPLKGPMLQNFYFAMVHTLTTNEKRKHLDEQQIDKLISMNITIFIAPMLYDLASFINTDTTFIGITALLIQISLNLSKTSQSKTIIKKSLQLVGTIWHRFAKKKEVYPQLCSTLFKIVNNEFDNQVKQSKSKMIALGILEQSITDLFSNAYSSTSKKTAATGIKAFVLSGLKTKTNKFTNSNTTLPQKQDNIALQKVQEFITILSTRIEVVTKQGSRKYFHELSSFCVNVIAAGAVDIPTLAALVKIFFFADDTYTHHTISSTPSESEEQQQPNNQPTVTVTVTAATTNPKNPATQVISMQPKLISAITSKYTSSETNDLMEILKQEMLLEVKRLPRLVNELMEERYVKTLRQIYRVLNLASATKADCFLPSEKELISDNLSKAMKFTFNYKIAMMDNPQSVIPLSSLDLSGPVTREYLEDTCAVYSKIKTYLILQSLTIANYKEDILREVNRIIYAMNSELAIYLFENFYASLVSVDYADCLLKGSVSSNVLAQLCESHYMLQQLLLMLFTKTTTSNSSAFYHSGRFDQMHVDSSTTTTTKTSSNKNNNSPQNANNLTQMRGMAARYFEHLMLLDFYENFEIKSSDVEVLQLLAIENAFYCYRLLEKTYDRTLKLLTFLLKKHAVENYSMRVLTEAIICTLAYEEAQESPRNTNEEEQNHSCGHVRNLVETYSSSMVQRSLMQIRQIDMLADKEGPFKLMDEVFVQFQGFHYLHNEVENVISTLNRCYDRFYLHASSSSNDSHAFTRLFLDFFSSFIRFWNKHTIVKQMSLADIEAQKNEYKLYSDDSSGDPFVNEPQKSTTSTSGDSQQGIRENLSESEMENKKIRLGNIMRHLLLRVKTLAVSKVKIHSVMTLQILLSSMRILYKLKQVREEDNVNFSTNDAENVQIPDTLGPLLHEFEASFHFILAHCAADDHSPYLASALQVILIYLRLLDFTEANYSFLMVKNIRKTLVPKFLGILKTHAEDFKNSIRSKVARAIVAFIVKYKANRPADKFLNEDDNLDDDAIIDSLKNYKQSCIKFLRESKVVPPTNTSSSSSSTNQANNNSNTSNQNQSNSNNVSPIYIEAVQEMFNSLDEFV